MKRVDLRHTYKQKFEYGVVILLRGSQKCVALCTDLFVSVKSLLHSKLSKLFHGGSLIGHSGPTNTHTHRHTTVQQNTTENVSQDRDFLLQRYSLNLLLRAYTHTRTHTHTYHHMHTFSKTFSLHPGRGNACYRLSVSRECVVNKFVPHYEMAHLNVCLYPLLCECYVCLFPYGKAKTLSLYCLLYQLLNC